MSSPLILRLGKLTYMVETISDRVRRAREEAGLTQQQLADACGISRTAIALWEYGYSKSIKAEHLFKAARALKKNPEWLANGQGTETPVGATDEIIHALPDDSGQQALDFIQYRIDKASNVIASDQIARYTALIEDIKRDLERRKQRESSK